MCREFVSAAAMEAVAAACSLSVTQKNVIDNPNTINL